MWSVRSDEPWYCLLGVLQQACLVRCVLQDHLTQQRHVHSAPALARIRRCGSLATFRRIAIRVQADEVLILSFQAEGVMPRNGGRAFFGEGSAGGRSAYLRHWAWGSRTTLFQVFPSLACRVLPLHQHLITTTPHSTRTLETGQTH